MARRKNLKCHGRQNRPRRLGFSTCNVRKTSGRHVDNDLISSIALDSLCECGGGALSYPNQLKLVINALVLRLY